MDTTRTTSVTQGPAIGGNQIVTWDLVRPEPVFPSLLQMHLEAAQRRMRQKRDRAYKRHAIHAYFAVVNLNGPREVARRLRQIESGRLQVSR